MSVYKLKRKTGDNTTEDIQLDYSTAIANKPTIPTVNDSTITITQGGVTKGSFTLNQNSNATIDVDAGGGDTSTKMDKANPTGTGSFSLNRKANTTVGNYSVAEGSNNTASGLTSHAEGGGTKATGGYSHTEGNGTEASGSFSHAEGFMTIAQRKSQHVFGEYNVSDTAGTTNTRGNYVEVVGNGTGSGSRSNARTLDWSGNEVLAGSQTATSFVKSGGTSSQFLKADGSVDSNTYARTSDLGTQATYSLSGTTLTITPK